MLNWIDRKLTALLEGRLPRVQTREEILQDIEKRHDSRGRVIAGRYARGNVNIKRGAFITKKDLEARRAASAS